MANSKSALKRVRQTQKKEAHNTHHVSTMRTAIKNFRKAVETGEGDAQALYNDAVKAIDRVAGKRLIHKNNANRQKTNLASLLHK